MGEIIISAGIRYSNIEPDHEMRAEPRPTGVSDPTQAKPVGSGNVAFGDRDEASKARFRSQQVVTVGVELVVGDAIPDGKLFAGVIKEKAEVHRLERVVGLAAQWRRDGE